MHDVILGYRDEARPFQTHNSLTPRTWSILPARLSPVVWFQYYQAVECFVRDHGVRRVYIHGTVFVPFETLLHIESRKAVYNMFFFNTPRALWAFLRFRLFFVASTAVEDQMSIERLGLTCIASASRYPSSGYLFEL